MLYFAYASNLNRRAMARRCPAATIVGPAVLAGYRLCFKRYADVAPDPAARVVGGLWEITAACRRALDAYEGEDYRAVTLDVAQEDETHAALVYVMAGSAPLAPPTMDYYREIAVGYREWGYDEALLRRARYDTLNVGAQAAPAALPPSAAPAKRRSVLWDPAQAGSGPLENLIKRR